jgi:hypothetical protein
MFGIQGKEVTSHLPKHIPLGIVISFAPKLAQWLLMPPDPAMFPKEFNNQMLREPHVGINVGIPVEVTSLNWIVKAMLQAAGVIQPREAFVIQPNLVVSVNIHKTWLALGLPVAGLEGLHMHMQARLSLGALLKQADMKMLWENFPSTSNIVHTMVVNYFRGVEGLEYMNDDIAEVVHWYRHSKECDDYFQRVGKDFATYDKARDEAVAAVAAKKEVEKKKKAGRARSKNVDSTTNPPVVETGGVGNPGEKDLAETKKTVAARLTIREAESDDSLGSVETVFWNPGNPDDAKKEDATAHDEKGESTAHGGKGEPTTHSEKQGAAAHGEKETSTALGKGKAKAIQAITTNTKTPSFLWEDEEFRAARYEARVQERLKAARGETVKPHDITTAINKIRAWQASQAALEAEEKAEKAARERSRGERSE